MSFDDEECELSDRVGTGLDIDDEENFALPERVGLDDDEDSDGDRTLPTLSARSPKALLELMLRQVGGLQLVVPGTGHSGLAVGDDGRSVRMLAYAVDGGLHRQRTLRAMLGLAAAVLEDAGLAVEVDDGEDEIRLVSAESGR